MEKSLLNLNLETLFPFKFTKHVIMIKQTYLIDIKINIDNITLLNSNNFAKYSSV